ncbi:MAG TPA: T9SS type A sorting domain-containing protein [Rhodothermales bacterium]|nr:T9SS type A sorting domain-containing protein [Rhodothermales bacterium]
MRYVEREKGLNLQKNALESARVDGVDAGRHLFRLRALQPDGSAVYSATVEVMVEMPEGFVLSALYPNPFNPQARCSLMVETEQRVRIAVFDILGRRVAVLHEGVLECGRAYEFAFDGTPLPSGTYLVQVTGETFQATRRALLLK